MEQTILPFLLLVFVPFRRPTKNVGQSPEVDDDDKNELVPDRITFQQERGDIKWAEYFFGRQVSHENNKKM
jgi:hypothetical protein